MRKVKFNYLTTNGSREFASFINEKTMDLKGQDYNTVLANLQTGYSLYSSLTAKINSLKQIPNHLLPKQIQNAINSFAKTKYGKGMIIYEYLNDFDANVTPYLTPTDKLFLKIQQDFSPYLKTEVIQEHIDYEKIIEMMKREVKANYLIMHKECGFPMPSSEDDYLPLFQYIRKLAENEVYQGVKYRQYFPEAVLSSSVPTAKNVSNRIGQLIGEYPVLHGRGDYYKQLQKYFKTCFDKKK
jgi:hypothetical protein